MATKKAETQARLKMKESFDAADQAKQDEEDEKEADAAKAAEDLKTKNDISRQAAWDAEAKKERLAKEKEDEKAAFDAKYDEVVARRWAEKHGRRYTPKALEPAPEQDPD